MDIEENERKPETKEDYEALAEKIIDSLMEGKIGYRWGDLFDTLIIEDIPYHPPVSTEITITAGEDRQRQTYNDVAKHIINQIMKGDLNYKWENDFKRLIISV